MKKIIGLIVLCAVVYAGYSWNENRRAKAFSVEMRKEFRGYRLEHFASERLLFLHAPDGSKEGMPLDRKCIEEISLSKTPASENAFNKDLYTWNIHYVTTVSPDPTSWIRRNFIVPYFSVEPNAFLDIAKQAVPEIDIAQALRYAKQLEHNGCTTRCMIWVHPERKDNPTPKESSVCRP
jgi:hypothetical protein